MQQTENYYNNSRGLLPKTHWKWWWTFYRSGVWNPVCSCLLISVLSVSSFYFILSSFKFQINCNMMSPVEAYLQDKRICQKRGKQKFLDECLGDGDPKCLSGSNDTYQNCRPHMKIYHYYIFFVVAMAAINFTILCFFYFYKNKTAVNARLVHQRRRDNESIL